MEYSEATQQFIFREIEFKTPTFDRRELKLEPDEIAFEDKNVIVSKDNPMKCLMCHGFTAQSPIWATYSVWPGAYGSDFNKLYLNFDHRDPSLGSTLAQVSHPVSQGIEPGLDTELKGYLRFLKSYRQNPRYRWLPPLIVDQGFERLQKGEPYAKIDLSEIHAAEQQRLQVPKGSHWPERPNQFFQDILINLNTKRMLTAIQRAGLPRGAFKSESWTLLVNEDVTSIHGKAQQIQRLLESIPSKHGLPSLDAIEARLRKNMTDEIAMQREKINLHFANFPVGAFPIWVDETKDRYGMNWAGPVIPFYKDLLGLRTLSDADRIAMFQNGDGQAQVTALDLLLSDVGIDLHNFTLTMHQNALSFYLDGLCRVSEYLGLEGDENHPYRVSCD